MVDIKKTDESGAYAFEPLVSEEAPVTPEEFQNPPGVTRGDCDDEGVEDPSCEFEATAQIEDLFLEETKPGIGILGFEGEEDGGS